MRDGPCREQAAVGGGNDRQQRFVLVHLHLFKNAGTTIERLLQRNLGTGFRQIHADHDLGVLPSAVLEHLLDTDLELRAVSSHHLRYPLPAPATAKLVDICFLRHPLQRAASMYRYLARIAGDDESCRMARTRGFADFLEYLLERQPFNVINAQTCFLANSGDFYFPPDELQERLALERMRNIRFLGTVERFDQSIAVARHFLTPLFPDFDWTCELANATEGRLGEDLVEASNERLRRTHGAIVDFFLGANRHDIAVWHAANAEIERRAAHAWQRPSSASALAAKTLTRA